MANNYSQFSERIEDITSDEAKWIRDVLHFDTSEDEDLTELCKQLGIPNGYDFDGMWPHFDCQLEDEGENKLSLWLYCEEGYTEDHLTMFLQAFIRRFRPDYIMSITGSSTCSKPRIGEFGGWWLVVSKDEVLGGNSWGAAEDAVAKIKKGR